jgi:hypothetical protein
VLTPGNRSQTVNFTFQRTFQTPHIPIIASIPLAGRLSSAQRTIHYDASLHLNQNELKEDGERSLLVTKVDVERREKAPLENLVYSYIKLIN